MQNVTKRQVHYYNTDLEFVIILNYPIGTNYSSDNETSFRALYVSGPHPQPWEEL